MINVVILLFVVYSILDLFLTYCMQRKIDDVSEKYNDLRVKYASLKSKRGVDDANN